MFLSRKRPCGRQLCGGLSQSTVVSDVLLPGGRQHRPLPEDRKSTRLNSSHSQISYAVFCLKKKKKEYVYQLICLRHIDLFGTGVSTRDHTTGPDICIILVATS